MTQKTFTVMLEKTIEVTIDETRFDDKFMQEFRDMFYQFHTHDDHMEHLAQLVARGYAGKLSYHELGEFIEGYGHTKEMGIVLKEVDEYWDVIEDEGDVKDEEID